MGKRTIEKKAYWREVFEEWSSSGISQRQFCEERGIAYSTFCYWRGQVLRDRGEEITSSLFLPVEVKPPVASSPSQDYEVCLENGVRIRVPPDFEGDSLLRLIRLLRSGEC